MLTGRAKRVKTVLSGRANRPCLQQVGEWGVTWSSSRNTLASCWGCLLTRKGVNNASADLELGGMGCTKHPGALPALLSWICPLQVQRYEAASTIYGPHTLSAYIQLYRGLAKAIALVSSISYMPRLRTSKSCAVVVAVPHWGHLTAALSLQNPPWETLHGMKIIPVMRLWHHLRNSGGFAALSVGNQCLQTFSTAWSCCFPTKRKKILLCFWCAWWCPLSLWLCEWAGRSWDILGLDLGDPSNRAAGVLQGLLLQAEHRWRSSALVSHSLYYSYNLCKQRVGGRAGAALWFLREFWLSMWMFNEHIFPLPECHWGAAPWSRAPTFQRNQPDPGACSRRGQGPHQ